MKYRDRYFYILVPAIQILFYLAAYEAFNYAAHKSNLIYSRGVRWGIAVEIYAVEYIIIIISLAILALFFEKRVLLLSVVTSVVFTFFVLPNVRSYPYRAGSVILIGTIGIFINYFLLFKYKMKSGLK